MRNKFGVEAMNEKVTLVFNGFLNLTNLEKLKMTEMINDYFDSNDREPIRAANEVKFNKMDLDKARHLCPCCRK